MVVSYWSLGLVEVYDLDPQATSASATYVRTIGSQGSGNAQLYTPERLVFTPSNSFLVADAGNNRVQELQLDGTWVREVPDCFQPVLLGLYLVRDLVTSWL